MALRGSETVTRLRRRMVEDEMSGQMTLGSWDDPDPLQVHGCLLAPGTSAEYPQVDVATLSMLATLYLPYGSDISVRDRVVARGQVWEVEGMRSDWRTIRGREAGSTVSLKWMRGVDDEQGEG